MELLWKKPEIKPNCNAGKHGYWQYDDADYGNGLTELWSCSLCGYTYMHRYSPVQTGHIICPQCGAINDEDEFSRLANTNVIK